LVCQAGSARTKKSAGRAGSPAVWVIRWASVTGSPSERRDGSSSAAAGSPADRAPVRVRWARSSPVNVLEAEPSS